MASNFDFLGAHFPLLLEHASQAESFVYTAPRASCFYSRFALEQAVQWLYANDAYLQLPYDKNLGALIHEQTFKDNLKPGLFPKVSVIHKIGNTAVHDATPINSNDALHIVKELFHFLYWLSRSYSSNPKNHPNVTFDSNLIPKAKTGEKDLSQQQLQKLDKKPLLADQMRLIEEEREKKTSTEIAALKAQIATLKQQSQAVPDSHNYNEEETRRYLIDVLLKEAGWNINQPEWTEYEVTGMPNKTGKGYVDYVLWGADGKPLAIIEAKRTRKDAADGKHQAELYANCLETRFNQRPIIFYSNGYTHWIWDDVNYPPREIQGFLKKDELERLIWRRQHQKSLSSIKINTDIVERSYQIEAINRITEKFDQDKGLKALLVMATGTGKTRTTIALVDVLKRANWVKRVLFLADRKALLIQAQRAFRSFLPNLSTINLSEDGEDNIDNIEVVLATYPTIINRINISDGGNRVFGSGHFDLVIVDEAHRSIYKKYRGLFDYFDGLLVGLTATPRKEIHRDTYRIFDLELGVPTHVYELSDAIQDGYLVPPKGIKASFKFLQKGVKYGDLSNEEKEEYEEKFQDDETGAVPEKVDATELNAWLFNTNTVDEALKLLMEYGLKVDGGDKLGKTIIFARNHNHAEFIVQRFDRNYSKYQGKFAQVIDSKNSYAQSLLDDFSDPNKQPTIAVSVDMLDTGVDVPEVVNLVFFKPVYSQVKFNQMIGRGTRLCKDLFGIGANKVEFFVFDLCSNFEFFDQQLPEKEIKPTQSVSGQLFKGRVKLSNTLSESGGKYTTLRSNLLDNLHQQVSSMERDNFIIRHHLQQVNEFSQRTRWDAVSNTDIETINQLAELPNSLPEDNPLSKQFDLLILKLQLAVLSPQLPLIRGAKERGDKFIKLRDQVRDLMQRLEQKRTVPMVKAQLPLIEELQTETWWTDVTPEILETIRRDLRDLIKFIDREEQVIVYTDFIDELEDLDEVSVPTHQTGFSKEQYCKKVETYIHENQNHVAIAKLKRNVALTDSDVTALSTMLYSSQVVESVEQFQQVYGAVNIKSFIRQLVVLDRKAAKQAFNKYLQTQNFGANQIRFVEMIIDYLTQNGVMDPGKLYEAPFTNLHQDGLDGLFSNDSDIEGIIAIVNLRLLPIKLSSTTNT
jgi:type I restriction enzyme R subunit